MVHCSKILETAREQQADVIGLSGLITPSLDEMCYVAAEMKKEGFEIPLLIGGATTSKIHTAVKIDPNYQEPVIYVPDASRVVNVLSRLMSDTQREDYVADINAEYEDLRERKRGATDRKQWSALAAARDNKFKTVWNDRLPVQPQFTGTRVFDDYPLEKLIDRIDWSPFFIAWDLHGKYPKILSDEKVGEAATKLFADAQVMLQQILDEKWITARAVVGFWPAGSVDHDDIELYTNEERDETLTRFHFLRQQMVQRNDRANVCLADYLAPKDSGIKDYLGAFVVSAGFGVEERAKQFEEAHDDYNSILLKALADRFAEAFAEHMHERVRKEFWPYALDEALDNEALIREKYTGIRPAPGYPACPDHSEKGRLFELLDAENAIGVALTESFAMTPAAAVSGFYFSHPEASYFGLGKINRDQVEDYARRKNLEQEQVERNLSPVLGYV
ncbi:MAG: vitamin B12 dependent-methionine synthase activation domain-containing protein [Verrucomicrobiota bacterium]